MSKMLAPEIMSSTGILLAESVKFYCVWFYELWASVRQANRPDTFSDTATAQTPNPRIGNDIYTYGVNIKSKFEIFLFLSYIYGWVVFGYLIIEYFEDDFCSKIDNLHCTDDGEPSEESHGSSNSW